MTSREQILEALNHRETDRVPLDLGSNGQTGMQVSTVYMLRQALKLDPPGTPVKVINVSEMLGEIKPDFLAAVALAKKLAACTVGEPRCVLCGGHGVWKK